MNILELAAEFKARKSFRVFADKSPMAPVEPVRKNVVAISRVLAECSELKIEKRYEYAKNCGIRPDDSGKYELPNTYTEFEATEEIALILFGLKREEVNFEELNEGELNIALAVFFMKRKGI